DYTLTTPDGCDSNVHVNVLFEPCCVELIQCPNVVTPNGDGSNDKFVITNLLEQVCYPYNELYVYNRYGNMVYSRRNIASESDWWDPSNLPDGTYFYYFKARNGDGSRGVERKGAVEVMRK
ncbi:MAG: gliding motility-associated C-terminal domain-containing protein, partial [Bacteroidales bacterium]|nr:gliding motility-associated C-terminal domain-containing protein [Bacteroidales bacterium]